ncbi:MAG: hypothetical protein J5563_07905 [Clostridia bacterium]|nr:hypothetical protein [Clostridia bacterium]
MEIRRMFASVVTEDDMFMALSVQAQTLYFHLGMNADDFGLLRPKKVLYMLRMRESVLKELQKGGYVIPLDDGVVAVTHWNVNNKMRSDKKKKSVFSKQLESLSLADGDTYVAAVSADPGDETVENVTDTLRNRAQNGTDSLQIRYDSVTEPCPSTVQNSTEQNRTDNSRRFSPVLQDSTVQHAAPFGAEEKETDKEKKERGGENRRPDRQPSPPFCGDRRRKGQYGGSYSRNPYKDNGLYHSFDPDEFFELALKRSEEMLDKEYGGADRENG